MSKVQKLTHRQRLERVLSGEKPDHIPIAFWRHFPVDDQNPQMLAKATLLFQQNFDLDLVKVSPSSSFCLKDWGVRAEWRGHVEGTRDYTHRVIHQPEDWLKLPVLNANAPALADMLTCLKIIIKSLPADTPIIQTIFSPLSQAKNLAHPEVLRAHIREYPDSVLTGLKTIQNSTLNFIEAIKKTGISGIFLALQHANHHLLTEKEYDHFGTPFDLEIFEEVKDLWLNMVHIHGAHIMFDKVATYPAQVINWHDQETPPTLAQAQERFPGVVCGGIHTDAMVLGDSKMIEHQIQQALDMTEGRKLIIGTGCVVPVTAPIGNFLAAVDYMRRS